METAERMTAITRLMREHYGDVDERPREPRDPYRTLIGCVLSHRTRDENSRRAASNLFAEIEGPLDILAMNQDTLKKLIRCSGFYNQKARSIVPSAGPSSTILMERFPMTEKRSWGYPVWG